MLQKNIDKEKRKNRDTWVGFSPKITKDKTKYSRKIKHKIKIFSKKFLKKLLTFSEKVV